MKKSDLERMIREETRKMMKEFTPMHSPQRGSVSPLKNSNLDRIIDQALSMVNNYNHPDNLMDYLMSTYSELSPKEWEKVEDAIREEFGFDLHYPSDKFNNDERDVSDFL